MNKPLRSEPLAEFSDPAITPTKVKLQASSESAVDDALVEGISPSGEVFSVAIGVRRDPEFVPSSTKTVKLIASYLSEIINKWEDIQNGHHRLALAVADRCEQARKISELSKIAASVDSAIDFRKKIDEITLDQKVKDRLPHLHNTVTKAAKTHGISTDLDHYELTWRLLSCLRVRHLRLEDGDFTDYTNAVERLRDSSHNETIEAAEALLSRIYTLVGDWTQSAMPLI